MHLTLVKPNPNFHTISAKSCPAPNIANGNAGSSPITPLERLIVNCNDGYDLSVDQSVTIKCYADDLFTRDNGASFSPDVPTCNRE